MREVVITPRAEKEINKIFEYLVENWNEQIKRKFAKKVYDVVQLIKENPELFPPSIKNKKIRKCVLNKQVSIFYHFNTKHIVIISIFDTRQDPNNIPIKK